jgi:glyoxylase-like metal-dependent hydrolase (beta-lactamase superfamily II)
MAEWKVGDVRISTLLESVAQVPPEVLIPAVTPQSVAPYRSWLEPTYLTPDGFLNIAVQALLVEADGRRIIVDTCFGNDRQLPYPGMEPLHTDFLERLAEQGFGADDVDVVVCTHLHFDHVGWNTRLVDGTWVPTFPHAQYLFGRAEYEHWQDHDDFHIDLTDSVEPIVAAGLHRFVEQDHQVTPSVHLVPSPGHTPGHVCVRIASQGEAALIGGDMVHHPVQIAEPSWASAPDYDPPLAAATRTAVLGGVAEDGTLFIGTHFAQHPAGYIRAGGDRWRWEPHPGV